MIVLLFFLLCLVSGGGFGFKSNDVSVDYNYGILYHGAIIAKFLSLS